jgi:nitrite reductase/ring-hydroxylating ferredoxin subunit
MKKYFLLYIAFTLFFGCTTNSPKNNNPYLPNYSVNLDVNLNLPQYSNLKFVSNAVFISGYGVRGIIVFNSGSGYYAFDAACPNQPISSCSTMAFKKLDPNDPLKIDVTHVVCSCDGAEYSLFSGQSPGKQYPLKQYRVEVNGTVLRIYN